MRPANHVTGYPMVMNSVSQLTPSIPYHRCLPKPSIHKDPSAAVCYRYYSKESPFPLDTDRATLYIKSPETSGHG